MVEILKRLIWDENYTVQIVRATVGLLGMMLISGAVTLDSLGEQFGRAGWYMGIVLTGCAWWIRAGDQTLRTLGETPDAALHQVGVETRPITVGQKGEVPK